jgi:limonene 1,2-monooxygenase
MYGAQSLNFGVFMGPYHPIGTNPTIAMQHDLELVELLDDLGYDEVWVGEHHSGGLSTIGSPELFIAAAAERTQRIRLGTGVASLPYHHPFMVADRIVQLSHQTRGRVMLGVGPGQLLKDASTLGIDPVTQRPRMEEALDVILRLFRGETVTTVTDWFVCDEGVLQMRPYSEIEVAVVGVVSPNGPKLAGRHGTAMISVAATDPVGVEKLAEHWAIIESESEIHGHKPDRANWRLLGPMHLADTAEQALEDVAHGMAHIEEHRAHATRTPDIDYDDLDGYVTVVNDSGAAVVGTAEMAIAQIERLIDKSGGFGTYLLMGHDWADWPATQRSFEIFAQKVMPHFTGQLEPLKASYDQIIDSGFVNADVTAVAQKAATERYEQERTSQS